MEHDEDRGRVVVRLELELGERLARRIDKFLAWLSRVPVNTSGLSSATAANKKATEALQEAIENNPPHAA